MANLRWSRQPISPHPMCRHLSPCIRVAAIKNKPDLSLFEDLPETTIPYCPVAIRVRAFKLLTCSSI